MDDGELQVRQASLRAPKGLVSWLRWLLLLASWSVVAATLPLITITHAPFPPVVASVAACGVLAVTWTIAYRAGTFPPWADMVTAVGLLLVMLQVGSLVHALPIALTAAAYRGVWNGRRRVLAATTLQACALVVAALVSAMGAGPPWAHGEAVVGVLLQLFVTLGTHEVSVHLSVHDRVARHRQVLTDAAGELLRAADPEAVAHVTRQALRRLLPADAAVAVALTQGDTLNVVASSDPSGALATGRRMPLSALPVDVRERIQRGEVFDTHARAAERFPTVGGLGETATLVAPLTSHGVLRGVALVRGEPLDDDALTVVGALVSEAALALATAMLTADLRHSETRFRSLVQNSSDLIAVVTERARIRYVSPAAQQVLGYAPDVLKGADLVTLVHPDDLPGWRHFLGADGSSHARWSTTCRVQHRTGAWRYTEVVATDARSEPGVRGIVLNMRDVTEQTMLEADLRRQATHDPLTSLPNRALFMDRVRESLADPERRLAVLFIDLDNFKLVNDRFGHAVGDTLLCSVAGRLRGALNGHTIARLGGDEFAVLADVPGGRRQAEALGRQVLDALDGPLVAGAHELRSRASIGIALGDGGVDDAGDLLRRADLAMYVAKGEGKACFQLFDRHTYETLGVQRRLQAELGAALESGELEVRYQPIVDLATREVCSAEALVRWHHPTFGLLGPSAFIHLAQEEGLLHELFALVLRDACLQARAWPRTRASGTPVAVSVNLAPTQLDDDDDLVGLVRQALDGSGLAPERLTLELTENVLVSDPQRAARAMQRLKRQGVALAVDDFGTGYSSLSYLRRLPVDVLKIDQTFVEALGRPDSGSALVRTIVNLCLELGLRTVAEGVEREDQREALRRLGCRYGQGFLFSRPLTAPSFRALMAEGGTLADARPLTAGGPAPGR